MVTTLNRTKQLTIQKQGQLYSFDKLMPVHSLAAMTGLLYRKRDIPKKGIRNMFGVTSQMYCQENGKSKAGDIDLNIWFMWK